MTMKKLMTAVLAATAIGSVSAAVDYKWANAEGGDLADENNFNPIGLPTIDDQVSFETPGAYTLTASKDVQSKLATFKDGDVTIDLGERTWTGNGAGNLSISASATASPVVRIVSGVVSNFYCVSVSGGANWEGHSTLIVANPGTWVGTSKDDLNIGGAGNHHTAIITNGATFHSGRTITIGNEGNAPNIPKCSHNGLIVTGKGTRLEARRDLGGSGSFCIGNKNAFNYMEVSDGAVYEGLTGKLGAPLPLTIGSSTAASNNQVRVLNGSKLLVNNNLTVSSSSGLCNNSLVLSNDCEAVFIQVNLGYKEGCNSNRIEVLDGSILRHGADTYLGAGEGNAFIVDNSITTNTAYDIRLGTASGARGNRIEVRNGGRMYTPRSFYCGFQGDASYNTMLVDGAGSWCKCATAALKIGNAGTGSGASGGGTGNVVRVSNGAVLESKGAVVGNATAARESALYVESGAALDLLGSGLDEGVAGWDALVSVDAGSIRNGGNFNIGKAASGGNRFEVRNGGFVSCIHFYVSGTDNAFLFAGEGTMLTNGSFDVTWNQWTSNSVMRIEDGAVVDIRRNVYLGHADGTGNAISVSNATLRARGRIEIRGDSTLEIVGSEALVESGNGSDIPFGATSTLRFVSDRNGFGKLYSASKAIAPTSGMHLVVDGREVAKAGGGTFEIVDANGIKDPFLENVTLMPEGTTITRTADKRRVLVKVPRIGLMIFVR